MPWHVDALVAIEQHDGKEFSKTTEAIEDPIQAEYELPRIEGELFEQQREMLEKAKADGLLDLSASTPSMPSANEMMTFDPMRGVGMPTGGDFVGRTR